MSYPVAAGQKVRVIDGGWEGEVIDFGDSGVRVRFVNLPGDMYYDRYALEVILPEPFYMRDGIQVRQTSPYALRVTQNGAREVAMTAQFLEVFSQLTEAQRDSLEAFLWGFSS